MSSSSLCRRHLSQGTARCISVQRAPPFVRPGSCACRASSSNNGNGTGAGGTSFDDDAASGLGKLRFNKRASELPPELRDLEIRETKDGSVLVDSTTGKVINDFGATRFDVAVRALRGELDPPSWTENTERNTGVLLTKLVNFPTSYAFQVVGKVPPGAEARQAFIKDVAAVVARACDTEVQLESVGVKERLGGKYLSLSVDVTVRAPEMISAAYEQLGRDERVKMKF